MAAEFRAVPPSPGVGARRRGPKILPKLPMSVFTPPNTGTSDRFPLAPSPSTIHPESVIDGHVFASSSDLSIWKKELDSVLGNKLAGAVVSLQGRDPADIEVFLQSESPVPILTFLLPLPLETGTPSDIPAYFTSLSSKANVHPITVFREMRNAHVEGIKWALQRGHVVDIEVQRDISDDETGWEALQELLDGVVSHPDDFKSKIVLSNVLPPPHPLDIPIVKLLTHPIYNAYQKHIAALSLYPGLYIKFIPPTWNVPTPTGDASNSTPIDENAASESKDKREWKRRVRMYLGPAVEAFGFERILFGSSPSSDSTTSSNAASWYSIARESLAELGLEQSDIEFVFAENARRIYAGTA